MADDEYQQKLRDLQKYVPFLETTIRRLKTETGKPREAQISKLQSLLEILTDTRKKLKYEALRKCEEVILKLYDKVEKKPSLDTMHKYMCRTPPDEKIKSYRNPSPVNIENEVAFSVARQKLKNQTELTPASPSPPLEPPILAPKPVVIPTERPEPARLEPRIPAVGTFQINQQNREFVEDGWCNNFNDNSSRWTRPIFSNRPLLANQPAPENRLPLGCRPPFDNRPVIRPHLDCPPRHWNPPGESVYHQRMNHPRPKPQRFDIWNRPNFEDSRFKSQTREVVSYADSFVEPFSSPPKIVPPPVQPVETDSKVVESPNSDKREKRQPIKISFSKPEKDIVIPTLAKPPLTESDLQDLLSPATDSNGSSGNQSPVVDEEMDLDKLEELRRKISQELEENTKPTKDKEKAKDVKGSSAPVQVPSVVVKPKSPRVVERVIKEQSNIFGSLLSSIDDQIMEKKKDHKKPEKKESNKKDEAPKKDVKKTSPRDKSETKSKDAKSKDDKHKPKDSTKSNSDSKHKDKPKSTKDTHPKSASSDDSSSKLSVKEVSKLNEKVKSNFLKDDKKEVKNKSDEPKSKTESKSKDDTVSKDKHKKEEDSKSKDKNKKDDKETTKVKDDGKAKVKPSNKSKESRWSTISKEDLKPKMSTETKDSDPKEIAASELSDKIVRQLEDLKNKHSKSETLAKLSDINKELDKDKLKISDKVHSSSGSEDNSNRDLVTSGRLSDKYPHKRKPSIEFTKPQNESKHVEVINNFDRDTPEYNQQKPKILNTEIHPKKLSDPRLRHNPNVPNASIHHLDSPVPVFCNEPENPNFAMNDFSNAYNECPRTPLNIFPYPNEQPQNFNNFCNEPQPMNMQGNMFPNEMQQHPGMNRPPSIEPFQPGNMTPGDPFAMNNFDPRKTPSRGGHFPSNNFNNMDQRNPEQFWNEPNPQEQFNMPHRNQFDRPGNIFPDGSQGDFHNKQQNMLPPKFPHQIMNQPRFPNVQQNMQQPNRMNNQNHFPNQPNRFSNDSDENFSGNFNQYDLSQMTPIDFFDNAQDKHNNDRRMQQNFDDCEPVIKGNSNRPFRGRGGSNRSRGNFARGRNAYSWVNPNRRVSEETKDDYPSTNRKYGNRWSTEEKEDHHRKFHQGSKYEDSKEDSYHSRKYGSSSRYDEAKEDYYNRKHSSSSRYSSEDSKDEHSNRKYNRYTSEDRHKDEPQNRKYPTSSSSNSRSSHDEATPPVVKKIVEEPIEPVAPKTEVDSKENIKQKEEIFSPLNSLYAPEKKKIGKGYGIQNFKIPKIKRVSVDDAKEEVKEMKKEEPEVSLPVEVKPVEDTPKLEEVIKKPDEVKKDEEPKKVDEEKLSPSSQSEEPQSDTNKSEADKKLDVFNTFMKQIFENCGTNVFLQLIDQLGTSLPQAKSKRIRRIIESDSEESEDESKDKPEKPSKAKDEIKETEKHEEEIKTKDEPPKENESDDASNVVESVGERIKSRRRKKFIYSSDSSPEKGNTSKDSKSDGSPSKDSDDKSDKKQPRTKRKNALELLQDDLREMFISEGVLTATGKRMCRIMKDHQESVLNTSQPKVNSPIKVKEIIATSTDDEEDVPLIRRVVKPKPAKVKKEKVNPDPAPEPVRVLPKRTRSSPRVVLEKLTFPEHPESSAESENEPETEPEEVKRPLRRTRRMESPDSQVAEQESPPTPVKSTPEKKTPAPKRGRKKRATKASEKQTETDKESVDSMSVQSDSPVKDKSEPEIEAAPERTLRNSTKKITPKKKGKRRNWALGVIKKQIKPPKPTEKTVSSPSQTSTEISDQLSTYESINDLDLSDIEPDVVEAEPTNTSDNEFSLLSIDLTPDVNYYLDNGKQFDCKLCDFKGKLIVHHYRTKHPESENMISRLSPEQAESAKSESQSNNFESIVPYEEGTKNKKRKTTFCCRFCSLTFKVETTTNFFDHICVHTGEYRWVCEVCSFYTGIRKTLHTHYNNLHPHLKPFNINPTYPGPPNFRLVFGYLCQACNFTQLLKVNVEKHIKVAHPNQNIEVIKINMSSKPVSLHDIKTGAEMEAVTDNKTVDAIEESPVEPVQEVTEPEKVPESTKEPDMTVFMASDDISIQEKLIEDERLKKMQEVISNITPRRSTLGFVDKLKSKLASAIEGDDLHEEINIDDVQEVQEPPVREEPTEKWIEIASTCSLANADTEFFDMDLDTDDADDREQLQSEIDILQEMLPSDTESSADAEEPEEPIDVSNVELSLPSDSKQKGVLDTIQRLAAKLQNPQTTNIPVLEPPTTPVDEPQNESSLLAIPIMYTAQPKPIEDQIINVGPIEVKLTKKEQVYKCLIPNCNYTTLYKISFTKHCSDQHPKVNFLCEICAREDEVMRPFTMTSLFVHLFDRHKNNAKKNENETKTVAPPAKIRIRRISGDVLSSFPNKETEIENENQTSITQTPENPVPILAAPQTQPTESAMDLFSGFLQISNVRTLTPEEETHLQLKENLTNPSPPKVEPKSPVKTKFVLKTKKVLVPVSEISALKIVNPPVKLKTIVTPEPATSLKEDKNDVVEDVPTEKSADALWKMMSDPKISHLYKCPVDVCCFSTPKRQGFITHLMSHDYRPSGYSCVYCMAKVKLGNLLLHIEKYHGRCMFQCPYCFFRALTGTYVLVHMKNSHPNREYKIVKIPLCKLPQVSLLDEIIPKRSALLPYMCSQAECSRVFVFLDDLKFHLQTVHQNLQYQCPICVEGSVFPTANALFSHYVTHKIALYQCRFCLFGAQKLDGILEHYAKKHFYHKPIAYMRKKQNLDFPVRMNYELTLDNVSVINIESFITKTRTTADPNIPQLEDVTTVTPPVQTTSPEIQTSPSDPPNEDESTSSTLNTLIDIIELSDVEESVENSEATTNPDNLETSDSLNEPLVTLKHRSVESRDAIANAIDPLNLDSDSFQTQESQFDNANGINFNNVTTISDDGKTSDNSSDALFNNDEPGLTGFDLYKCGTPDCNFKTSSHKDFKNHMFICDVLKVDGGYYMCYHCEKRFNFVAGLVDHIQVHGPQRFSCSLCSFKKPQRHLIEKHMKMHHKIQAFKLVPVDPQKNDLQTDKFVAVLSKPKSKKPKESETEEIPTTNKVEEKNMFGPEDIELLPRPPVYSQEIKCKLCSYNTKVRSNMQRHLQQHIDEKAVPDSAPVNPVPCLEKNEKMFDKMTNLAASSHYGSRMGGKPADKAERTITKGDDSTYPEFIPFNKRYVCGAEGCNYLTHGDAMLRHHYTALHVDETSYKCPHCNIQLQTEIDGVAIDNILFHLKMHDLHLYKCSSCSFYHYQKHKVERHVNDSHADGSANIQVIRELDNSANLEDNRPPPPVEPVEAQEVPKPWRCGFCPFRTQHRNDIITHVAQVHGFKSQFKCGVCQFRCSAKNNYTNHFRTKHPNREIEIVSVYYKVAEESPTKSNVVETVVDPVVFNTTPLWSKNKSGVRHIRGILLDDSKSPKKKTPKVIEKLAEAKTINASPKGTLDQTIDEIARNLFGESSKSEKDNKDNKDVKESNEDDKDVVVDVEVSYKVADSYGMPEQQLYVCPFCATFKTKSVKEFISHLHAEMQYFRCVCQSCNHKSVDITEAKDHWIKNHLDEGRTEKITPLAPDSKVESWIEKCVQHQQTEMNKPQEDEPRDEDDFLNSSCETVVLDLNTPSQESSAITSSAEDEAVASSTTETESVSLSQGSAATVDSSVITVSSAASQNAVTLSSADSGSADVEDSPLVESPVEGESSTESPLKQAAAESKSPRSKRSKTVVEDLDLKCVHCDFVGKTTQTLRKHVNRHFTHKRYKCTLCAYRGAEQPSMMQHFSMKHPGQTMMYDVLPPPDKPVFRQIKRKRSYKDVSVDETPAKIPALESSPVKTKTVRSPRKKAAAALELSEVKADPDSIKTDPDKIESQCFYICFHCPRRSESLDIIRSHFLQIHEKVHKGSFKYKKLTLDKNTKTRYGCKYCPWAGDPDGLKQHHLEHHNDKKWIIEKAVKYRCNVCQRIYTKVNPIRKHFQLCHPDEHLTYQTVIDGDTEECVDTVEILEEMIELKPVPKFLHCDYCSDTFEEKSQLVSHHNLLHSHLELKLDTSLDGELKKYKCPQCGHASDSYPAMRDHLRNHNKPYKCRYCPLTGCYPNIIKTHHVKEHRNLEFQCDLLVESQKLNEELRENLLLLCPDGVYRTKNNSLKRQATDTSVSDQPATKVLVLDESASENEATVVSSSVTTKKSNVAKKSTAKPPLKRFAKKSTTPRKPESPKVEGFSFYGTKPRDISEYKNVTSELTIMGKSLPINVVNMSHILNLFPTVDLIDIGKENQT